MEVNENVFQDYLVSKGFKKEEHFLIKKEGKGKIICSYSSGTIYSTYPNFYILYTNNDDDDDGDGDGDGVGDLPNTDVFYNWDEFKSNVTSIIRDLRLNTILDKNKNKNKNKNKK